MYVLIQNNIVTAYSDEQFSGYTHVVSVPYAQYVENPNMWVWNGEDLVESPNAAEIRKEEFLTNFFEIKNVGFFRRVPKGYNSAIESLNTVANMVSLIGSLPANTLTFYREPDYTKAHECTEEWLVKNSFKNGYMSAQEFGSFYANFVQVWNSEEHL